MGACASQSRRKMEHQSTNAKIMEALRKKKDEKENDPVSMEKIILKFHKLKGTCSYLKRLFHSVADKSAKEPGLDVAGLTEVLTKLHGEMKIEDIQGLYRFCDIDNSNKIDLKEYLVALTVDHMLEKFPVIDVLDDAATEGQLANSAQLNEYFELIIQAYLLFDPEVKVSDLMLYLFSFDKISNFCFVGVSFPTLLFLFSDLHFVHNCGLFYRGTSPKNQWMY